MKSIKLMNKIAAVGTDVFDRSVYTVSDNESAPDAIMVRSASLHEIEFPESLKAIARCGAGVNNIPTDKCAEQGIVVFNTPGGNANGVKELAIAALILASRNISGGIEWVKTLAGTEGVAKAVEAGKGAFVGCELAGKTLGVVGLGAIGCRVANAASSLGMTVYGFDPYLSVNAAWNISIEIKKAESYDELFSCCDYISLHVPATPETKNLISEKTLSLMKDGVRIINLSRADLVNADDVKKAIENGKVACYVTDFPTEATVGADGIINIPHLGASTNESEDNCAVMAARQLDEYLTNGNIKNSVNFPSVSLPRQSSARVCVLHKNEDGVLSAISTALEAGSCGVDNLAHGVKGNYAYTIAELSSVPDTAALDAITSIDGVIKLQIF